jgi:butyrate kinase
MMDKLLLIIYPRASYTRIAVYDNRKQMFLTNIRHPLETLATFKHVIDQLDFRKKAILEELNKASINLEHVNAIVGRGGLYRPMEGGVYKVTNAMIRDTKKPMDEHEANLGGAIAYELLKETMKDTIAIVVDPACVDEMDDISKISGIPEITRKSMMHTLNQRTVARRFAREIGKNYEDINVIVAHFGNGISVGAHKKGRIIDVNNGLIGDGPMSIERSGSLPAGDLVELCYSGKYTKEDILNKLKGKGGVYSYIGIKDIHEIEQKISQGDQKAALILAAVGYQASKEIGGLSTTLQGEIDGILLTGELANSDFLMNYITSRIKHLGQVRIYPGDNEMESLAMYGYMVLDGEIEAKEYK